ncbi:MAG: phosphoenolpyruvate synthase [Gammaproteobacteria bacterium]
MSKNHQIIQFEQLRMQNVDQVGGKNASLGEMISQLQDAGVEVPGGFATSAQAYRDFIAQKGLQNKIYAALDKLDIDDVRSLAAVGKQIRQWIVDTPFLADMEAAVKAAYEELVQTAGSDMTVAVRSSATAEDLPEASFAGQQETFLNISGIDAVLQAIKQVYASLFNDRAIAYRIHQDFSHRDIALSAGIQRMVRSDLGASGVMFTIDPESGFNEVVFINAAYGLGETVVQGSVNPDEFYVYKPTLAAKKPAILRRNLGKKHIKMVFSDTPTCDESVKIIDVSVAEQLQFSLTDADIEHLAELAVIIEKHYGRPMDIEWGKDGIDGKLYILQARPETVESRSDKRVLVRYSIKDEGKVVVEGRSIGQLIGRGKAKVISNSSELHRVQAGDVLVSDLTDPDWEPVMKKAAAIVTNRGGRTCHAAIIARELGIPAVVGCGNATEIIMDGSEVTVSCAQGETGFVYSGLLDFEVKKMDIENMPELPVKVMLNVANPERAFAFQSLPNAGIGLARLEFIINNTIGIHPRALLEFASLPEDLQQKIKDKTSAYASPIEYYVERLKEGIATLAAAFYPKPVIVRLSDFKSNEYANLLGGDIYEPKEENPMLGYRGASRYVSADFRDCFALECQAVQRVRLEMGLKNVEVMIPFVRTVNEARKVIEILEENGLKRGKDDLRLIMMCELPTNALLAEEFLNYFDGFSIGSNDLTQLTLGLDRDSALVAEQFDERDAAVKKLLHMAIQACRQQGKYVGICGQGPSDHQDFAKWLMEEGIDSISLNPDSVLETCLFLANSN